MNEANSYTEEVRRAVNENYGFEKLYSQGLSIRTPLNINYQTQAINSLRKGIEQYDKRHGWRGPITNKINNKNWKKKLDKYKLDPTLNWSYAEIISFDNTQIKFKIINNKKTNIEEGFLGLQDIKWTIPKKINLLKTDTKLEMLIFVKKEKSLDTQTVSKSKWRDCCFRSLYWRRKSFSRRF